MSFERDVILAEIARLQFEKSSLESLQTQQTAQAVAAHVAAHNTAISALEGIKSTAGEAAQSVLQAKIDKLTQDRDALQEHDYTAEIAAIATTITQLEAVLPST